MTKRIFLVAALGACTSNSQPATPLAQFPTNQVEIVTNGKVNIELHVDETAGCPVLADDVSATFDGQPMLMTHGGYDTDASGCYPIAFWFNDVPMASLMGFERTTNASELVVHDSSATWTIDTVKLFANDFLIDSANAQVLWTDVSAITSAQVFPGGVTKISGNAISYTPGTQLQYVQALAHPIPTRCDGPGVCLVNLEGSRNFIANP